jgi:hypothetical protein
MNDRRDLERELAELSAEEEEIEKLVSTGQLLDSHSTKRISV